MSTPAPTLKQQAKDLIERLPDDMSWDDLAYETELRASIARGLADAKAGRVISVEDLMEEFGVEK